MESGDDGLESEANVRPRPCLTGAGSPGAQSTATDRGPSRQARLNRSAEGARTAYSARHTCPKTPETQSRNRSVRQAARPANSARQRPVDPANEHISDAFSRQLYVVDNPHDLTILGSHEGERDIIGHRGHRRLPHVTCCEPGPTNALINML